jgi:hypothetical protein
LTLASQAAKSTDTARSKQRLGDGEGKQNPLLVGVRSEGVVQGLLGPAGLLVDELAADVMEVGEVAERLRAGKGFEGQTLALARVEAVSGATAVGREGPLGRNRRRMERHVCFLLVLGSKNNPSGGKEQTFACLDRTAKQLGKVLPGCEPGPVVNSLAVINR